MSTAPPKESSTFSQEEIDALFSGSGFNPPPAAPTASPSPAVKEGEAQPEAAKPPQAKPIAAQSSAPAPAQAKSPSQQDARAEPPPRPDSPGEIGSKPPETKPAAAQSITPKSTESKPLEPVVNPVAAAPSASPARTPLGVVLPQNRSGLALMLASFLTGIIVTLVGIYSWHHPFFVPQSVLTVVARVRSPRPTPPPPQQRVFVGTPLQVAAQFNSLEGFSISTLACTGYQPQGAELLPIITLVVSETHTTDRLVCASDASMAEMSVNRLFQDGYKVHCSLVSLPAFRQGATKPSQTWYLFALRKEPGQTPEAKMTLFETESKTARILEDLLHQGWRITAVASRPFSLQTNYIASSTTMAAVFLERSN